MITRGSIADCRSSPFGRPVRWTLLDIVLVVPVSLVVVLVGLPLLSLLDD